MLRTSGFLLALLVTVCLVLVSMRPAGAAESSGDSAFRDKPGEHLDVLLDGRIVARYMYAYDRSTPERRNETYKPYLHVFDAQGQAPITKGSGGLYPHHRGIFIGWNRMQFGGRNYDRWHMNNGEIVHQKFAEQNVSPAGATFTSITHWNDEKGRPMIEETRTMTIRRAPDPARLIIDFTSRLNAPNGDVVLDGDPEHAGIHYRPANEIVKQETRYVFPKEDADPRKDLDYPWVGETYTLNGRRHSVVQMNHPDNPDGTKFSAYRDYGRFGAFFKETIPSGQSLDVKYRFLIADGEMPPAGFIQKIWDDFAGAKTASPEPKLTIKGSPPKKLISVPGVK